jgi:hypothetical protein
MTPSVVVKAIPPLEDPRRKECDLELLGIYKGEQLSECRETKRRLDILRNRCSHIATRAQYL